MTSVRLGVMGAGSIGGYVAGALLAKHSDVVLVGRARVGAELAAHGLTVRDFDRPATTVPAAQVRFATEAAALADRDVVLVCVKSAQTAEVAAALAQVLRRGAIVASFQNGVRNAAVLRAALGDRVVAGIVEFNVVSRGEGVFHRAISGALKLARTDAPPWREAVAALRGAGLEVREYDDLGPEQWSKLVINLNNAVSALSGAPSRDLLRVAGYRRIVAAVIEEAVAVLRNARIPTARLRGIPVRIMPRVLRLPDPIVRVITRAQMRVDPEARSSMWEDLTRGRPTEVDYLNGEIVRLAEAHSAIAPLNRRICALVHEAERAAAGSPNLSADALWTRLNA
ncbi:MAG: 2-dehydropantoate 2-reductase [Deltaproteobacteria bacterium]|nr:2-dehydropantoate 2-reductase [Deltaproteobacteria bacterium]